MLLVIMLSIYHLYYIKQAWKNFSLLDYTGYLKSKFPKTFIYYKNTIFGELLLFLIMSSKYSEKMNLQMETVSNILTEDSDYE